MKSKLVLSCILLFSLFNVHAQKNIPKGSLLLGGDISFNRNTYENASGSRKGIGFSIAPAIGLAIKDNLFVGLNGGYSFSKNTLGGDPSFYDSLRSRGYSYGVFVRKYQPLKSNFYLFLQAGLRGSHYKRDFEDPTPRNYYDKQFSVGLSLTPGLSYGITSKLHMEVGFNNIVGIGYTRTAQRDDLIFPSELKQTSFNAFTSLNNFNSQLYLGFRLLLQKKSKSTAG